LGATVEIAGVDLPAVLGGALMVERGTALAGGLGNEQGDAAGAEFAHPVTDDLVVPLAEFLRFQAGEGAVVEDAAELFIREEDEVDIRGRVVKGGAWGGRAGGSNQW
jgi:hypothetical protein